MIVGGACMALAIQVVATTNISRIYAGLKLETIDAFADAQYFVHPTHTRLSKYPPIHNTRYKSTEASHCTYYFTS